MSQITISKCALSIYYAAQGIEFQAAIAYALDTKALDKKGRMSYNRMASEVYGLSLKTMQNRASIAVKIQEMYAPVLDTHSDCNEESVRSFNHFFMGEMNKAHKEFTRSLEDMSRFLSGKQPEKVETRLARERKEAADKAAQEAKQAADKKQSEAKQQAEADMSGSPEQLTKGAVVEASSPVGEDAPAPAPIVAPDPAPLPDSQTKAGVEVLVQAIIDEAGDVKVSVMGGCDVSTLGDIILALQAKYEELTAEQAKAA